MQRALLVFGGNGLVGSAACKYAVSQGLKVISISRTGRPRYAGPWTGKVEYVKGDAMDPSSYKDLLPSVSAVMHSIGVLVDSKVKSWSDKYQGSYEHMSRDTALTILSTLEGQNKPFVFISAERGIPVLPRYLETKREVEKHLLENADKLPSVVLRPGFMYSDDNWVLRAIAIGNDALHWPDSLIKKAGLQWVSDTLIPAKSLPVDLVGKVAVLSACKSELRGRTLCVEDIAEVGQQYKSLND